MTHRGPHDPRQRLNDHHGDDLLAVARAYGGHPDATSARAERVDDDGIDLSVETPHGPATSRVSFTGPVARGRPRARLAFRTLAGQARAALDADAAGPTGGTGVPHE